jgi:hypothetical protein
MTTLHDLNVQAARRDQLAKEIAAFTGLSLPAVRGRLKRAHGRRLLRNLFADVWPGESRPARQVMPAEHVSTPRSATRAPERTIHRVRQAYVTSCGVAVVAMLACREHDEVLAFMFPRASRRRVFYTGYRDIIAALDKFNVKHGLRSRRVSAWEQIPSTSVVLEQTGDNDWHWVILRRKPDGGSYVLDPAADGSGTLRLTPDEQEDYPPVSYLTVEPIRPLPKP